MLVGSPRRRQSENTLGRLAYRAAQRAITLDVTRVLWLEKESLRLPETDRGFDFRFLTADDIYLYAPDPANELQLSLAARLQGGRDLSYAALADDRLAAYVWLALGSIESQHNRGRQPDSGVALSFDDDVAFAYKGFTRAEFRGRRLYSSCMARALTELAPRGIRSLLATADWTNRAALRACQQIGFRDLGPLWRFGRGKAMFTVPPLQAKSLGVRFDRRAQVCRRIDQGAGLGQQEG